MEFWTTLFQEQNAFLRYALLAGVLAGVACGVIGPYVVTRRISYLAGGIAHCVLGGMGAARYCQVVLGWNWARPFYGALLAALLAAVIIGWVSLRAREREDTIIGALWAVGMAVGILFISRTPGYNQELMSYLFGNILMVTRDDLWLLIGLDIVVVVLVYLCYNQLLAVCFDEEFARLRGLKTDLFYLLLLCLIALSVVMLISVVGIIMVIALLTLPAAIAGHLCRSLWQMMLLATALSILFVVGGLTVSFAPNLPAGATSVVLAAAAYLFVTLGAWALRHRPPTS